jgi:cell division protein ZapA (FtsZ GTPase activity inhibitor)
MSKVRARSGTADSVDIAVLSALNLASSVTEGRGVVSKGQEQRIAELARLVETALQDNGPATS